MTTQNRSSCRKLTGKTPVDVKDLKFPSVVRVIGLKYETPEDISLEEYTSGAQIVHSLRDNLPAHMVAKSWEDVTERLPGKIIDWMSKIKVKSAVSASNFHFQIQLIELSPTSLVQGDESNWINMTTFEETSIHE